MTDHETLALADPSSLPDHKKFLISRYTWLIQDPEKIQQEVMYHTVAKSTWLATTTRPARESLAELQKISFLLMLRRRGAICCSAVKSSPT